MFGFLRRKKPVPPTGVPETPAEQPSPVDRPDTVAPAPVAAASSSEAMPVAEAPPPEGAARAEATPAAEPEAVPAPEPEAVPAAEPEAVPAAEPEPEPADEPQTAPARGSWMARLKQGLSKTRGNLAGLFTGAKIDDALYEELETALLMSDAGVETTQHLLESLRQKVRRERIQDAEGVRKALRTLLADLLRPLERPIDIDAAQPLVMMIAGVNGAGKTTSIGKLARHLQREGKSVLLAAGDTFRAAAREQLVEWGSRNGVQVISQQGGDPAAVAFDAVNAGRARGVGVVMIDTAGRLPTQLHLMDELKKIHRVIGKAMPDAPHEVLIVLDGNTGQNMLAQVRAFDDAIGATGLVVTKLDGTAKGGTLAALAWTRRDRPIPVCFIGVGEGIDDLQGFSADEFASALLD
jgi:fused signal recognition particle receptor